LFDEEEPKVEAPKQAAKDAVPNGNANDSKGVKQYDKVVEVEVPEPQGPLHQHDQVVQMEVQI
jgi:hypothetical protein